MFDGNDRQRQILGTISTHCLFCRCRVWPSISQKHTQAIRGNNDHAKVNRAISNMCAKMHNIYN